MRALGKKRDQPFFLACGIFRPHLPWYAPKKYFDLYPLEKIKLPERIEGDLHDVPSQGVKLSAARRNEFLNIKKQGKWKDGVRSYLASISFADAQLGRLLDALEKSAHADNVIIVFWSDHGWHLGEKNHWHKSTLWEEATRIPFMISVPGLTKGGTRCNRPVDTLCVFPTLVELCGLKPRKDLEGVSIVPLLKNPEATWDLPAVTEYKRGNAPCVPSGSVISATAMERRNCTIIPRIPTNGTTWPKRNLTGRSWMSLADRFPRNSRRTPLQGGLSI